MKADEDPQTSPEGWFAQNLRALREHTGWSQSELARRMAERGFKWHAATVYSVESGERKIPLDEAVAIARLLGTSVDRMGMPAEKIQRQMDLDQRLERFRFAASNLLEAVEIFEQARAELTRSFNRYHEDFGKVHVLARIVRYSAYELLDPTEPAHPNDLLDIHRLLSQREAAEKGAG